VYHSQEFRVAESDLSSGLCSASPEEPEVVLEDNTFFVRALVLRSILTFNEVRAVAGRFNQMKTRGGEIKDSLMTCTSSLKNDRDFVF